MWAGLTPDSKGDQRVIPKSLFAADRRHHTSRRKGALPASRLSRRPAKYRAKKTKGLEPHPKTVSDTAPRQEFSPTSHDAEQAADCQCDFFFLISVPYVDTCCTEHMCTHGRANGQRSTRPHNSTRLDPRHASLLGSTTPPFLVFCRCFCR